MARFYRIQIGSIYLTRDGSNGATPCKLAIAGLEDLLTTVIGAVEPSASGVPIFQTFAYTKNKAFEIKVEILTKDVWEDLTNLINTALEENQTLSVIGTGDQGNFNVTARPNPQKPFLSESFINERIRGANFRFITV